MKKKIKHLFSKKRGQAIVEYGLIIAILGFVFAYGANMLFQDTKVSYYNGMTPLSKGSDIPPPPKADDTYEQNQRKKPVAQINGKTSAKIGETITLTDVSYDLDGVIKSTSWGTKTITRTFYEEGEYSVFLDVVDNHGLTGRVEHIISIRNELPTANIQLTTPTGLLVKIDGSGSKSPDGSIVAQEWILRNNKGEEIKQEWSLQGYSFALNELPPGQYTISLRVQDNFQTWSERVSRDFESEGINNPPLLPTIDWSTVTFFNTDAQITLKQAGGVDMDGDLVRFVWIGRLAEKSRYPSGPRAISLYAVDSKGAKSKSSFLTFYTVDEATKSGGISFPATSKTVMIEAYSGMYIKEVRVGLSNEMASHLNLNTIGNNTSLTVEAFDQTTGKWIVDRGVVIKGSFLKTLTLDSNKYTRVRLTLNSDLNTVYNKEVFSVGYEFHDAH